MIAVAVTAFSGHKTPAQQAQAYVTSHGADARHVAANVAIVQLAVMAGQKSGAQDAMNQVALAAQKAHDNIDNVRANFASDTTSDGALGNDETEVFAAANDLKNAMGAAVAYTGDPNSATLAQFTTKYQKAVGEWNDGVQAIWTLAGKSDPPTL